MTYLLREISLYQTFHRFPSHRGHHPLSSGAELSRKIKMKVKTCKNLPLAAVLAVLLSVAIIPAQCSSHEHLATANFTGADDISSPPGLHRIKPLAPGQQNPPAVPSEQRKSPNAASSSSAQEGEEKSPGTPSTSHHSPLELDDPEKKVNNNLESRSNSSTLEGGIIPSKHPLFADHHHNEHEAPGSDHNSAAEDDEAVAAESSVHEHVERYQQHQSAEDSEEDSPVVPISGNAHLNHPKATILLEEENESSHPKLVDSVVVSSDSFPVRAGPNVRVRGNANGTGGGIGIRKPIPVIRHEESIASANADGDHGRIH